MTLWSDFLTNSGRAIHKWTHYFPIYEAHIGDLVNKSVLFIEIGCGKGGSLQMWKRYLGPFATIVGIDIDPRCKDFEEDQVHIRIGDQGDPHFLESILDEFGTPDVVLDDGSHVMTHVKTSFDVLYPHMSKNGVYIVEDLHTAYWEEYEGGVGREGTFIEKCKSLIDELNADHSRGVIVPTGFSKNTVSMHFYDSVVVFRRGWHVRKHAPVIGE